ncbi:MAG: ABC transporter permease [Fervidicoccaceae archaeon]
MARSEGEAVMLNGLQKFLKYLRMNLIYMFGFAIVLGFFILGIVAPYILTRPGDAWGTSFNATEALKPPSLEHPFGTDNFGRDMLNRVILGARFSLIIAVSVVGIALIIGIVFGLVGGYIGGAIGTGIMRIADMFLAFPPLLLAVAFAAVLGRGVLTTIVALALSWWPWYARYLYVSVTSIKSAPYVEAAVTVGASRLSIMFRHILPNSLVPVITQATLDIGSAVLEAASLSFLGVGVPPPIPEWGRLITEGWPLISNAWWISLFPGIVLMTVVTGFTLFGDAVKEYMNPKIRNITAVVRPGWMDRFSKSETSQ